MWLVVLDTCCVIIKQERRGLLALHGTGADRSMISHRLCRFYRWCADSNLPQAHTLATTVETWWPALEALSPRTSSGNACGCRNPTNHQRRVRLYCTRARRRKPARVSAASPVKLEEFPRGRSPPPHSAKHAQTVMARPSLTNIAQVQLD